MLFSYFFRYRHVTVCGSRYAEPGNGSSEYLGANAFFCYFRIKSKTIDFRGAGVCGIEGGKSNVTTLDWVAGVIHRHRTSSEDWARMSIPFCSVSVMVPCTHCGHATLMQPDDFVAIGRLGNASFCHVTEKARSPNFFHILLLSSLSCFVCFVKSCPVIGYVGSDCIRKFSLSRQRTKRHHPPFPFPPESP